MSDERMVWLIDDKKRRQEDAKNLSSPEGITVEHYFPSSFSGDDGKFELPHELPDLVLIDWELEDNNFDKNISLLGHIREQSRIMPIYGYSEEDPDEIPIGDREHFDEFLGKEELERPVHGERLLQDIESYKAITDCEGGGFDALLELLDVAGTDHEAIRQGIPTDLYGGIPENDTDTGDLIRAFASWIRDELVAKPGMLWNRTWMATKLGIQESVLDDYRDHFKDAEYESVFSHYSDNVWWETKVYQLQRALEEDEEIDIQGQLWERAPAVLGAPQDAWSICAECNGKYPQTVAWDGSEKRPVHYSCSFIEDTRESPFEDLRYVESRGSGS